MEAFFSRFDEGYKTLDEQVHQPTIGNWLAHCSSMVDMPYVDNSQVQLRIESDIDGIIIFSDKCTLLEIVMSEGSSLAQELLCSNNFANQGYETVFPLQLLGKRGKVFGGNASSSSRSMHISLCTVNGIPLIVRMRLPSIVPAMAKAMDELEIAFNYLYCDLFKSELRNPVRVLF